MIVLPANTPKTGYNLTRSLRTRASASAYLKKVFTFGTNPNDTSTLLKTYAFGVKRGALNGAQNLISNWFDGNNYWACGFDSNNCIVVAAVSGGVTNTSLVSTPVYRDPSGFYFVQFTFDTTQATSTNRIKISVNGVQITSFSTATYPTQNTNSATFFTPQAGTWQGNIGAINNGSNALDGYLTEFYVIDGQALTPSSFGSTNSTTGVWQPARYTGTYGTNGFYLPFTDNSALTTASNVGLGKDFSGNGNYWTTNNISITAGTTYDSMTDVPTLTSATAANFAVLNPLNAETGMTGTLAGGNLNISGSGGKRATIAAQSGKWYWEFVSNSAAGANFPISGLYVAGLGTYWPGYDGNSFGYFQGGDIYYNGSVVLTVSSFTDGDLLGFAWDAATGKVWVSKNGTWQNSGNPAAGTGQVTTISTGVDRLVGAYSVSGSSTINFGQRPFTYTPPSGFVALNTFNLPTGTILKGNTVMDATLYTGTLLSNSVTNAAGFKPDLVWLKSRSAATSNELTDSVRGVTKALISNASGAEATAVQGLTAFNTNGFTVGTDTDYNNLAATYVAWQWQAGQGSSSSNTNGTITSTVSVNASAGFSVVTYKGNGTAGATVGHGLGVSPKFIIVKNRTTSQSWLVYHSATGNTNYFVLNGTTAATASAGAWNNTSPTSTVFSLGNSAACNESGSAFVAYCWADIAGFSSIGSYSGNGDGTNAPFIYTGFAPELIIAKASSGAASWIMWDAARSTYNVVGAELYADLSNAETTGIDVDFLSNGFKFRNSTNTFNAVGSYVYIAFAKNPFKNSLAR